MIDDRSWARVSDGVVLDFTDRESGYRIMPEDVDAALARSGYTLKERDIVLIRTGASSYNTRSATEPTTAG